MFSDPSQVVLLQHFQHARAEHFSNASISMTFAATTLVLTPFVRNQKAAESKDLFVGRRAESCSVPGQDCHTSQCCQDQAMKCYQKDQVWAGCKSACTPGVSSEPAHYQTPWSCTPLGAGAAEEGNHTCPYTCVRMETTLRMHMACSVACQALFALVVIHGCCFFDLGLVACIQHCVIFPNFIFSICSNPSTNSTFAVTPLVLTPLVRNQVMPYLVRQPW